MADQERPLAEYVARLEQLLDASFELCNHIGTGWEPHGQSMSATMGQQAVREFRQAVGRAIAARNDGLPSQSEPGTTNND